ncbi:hypothetical protein X011_09940 [Mycobacterium tuberculosis variant microti OV254]|nr:hypothetical protein X011_09940 [Mycobacterium tuberculosis variant microti OV254]
MLLGDEYYRALQQDNVVLVTEPIERITQTSVVTAAGAGVDVDAIVYILPAGARLVASAVSRLARRGGYLEVRPETERRYNDRLSLDLERTIWTQCDNYFRSPTCRIVTQWPYTELEYARRT